MKTALATFLLVTLIGIIHGVTHPECPNSLSCEANTCCRDANANVIPSETEGHWGFGLILGGQTGSCIPGRAQKGESCDSICKCDCGLECYRPMSGVCCPPHRCYDAQWVKEQREYWANCSKNPKCFFPAK